MDRLKEHQLTLRASRRPVEYNYTNADIHHVRTTPSAGYQFEYPLNWTGDASTQKVIGLRRISYKPSSIDVAFTFRVETDQGTVNIPMIYVFTDQNTFEECINRITVDANAVLVEKNSRVRCVSHYNKETGTFSMSFDDSLYPVDFNLLFDFGFDSQYDATDASYANESNIHYKCEFLKLFNQEITKDTVDGVYYNRVINSTTNVLTFENVWNRDSFYAHASFSDSPKQIIGINNDFWCSPSVFYQHSDNSNDFNVYFTTDTVHRILPRNGVMLIQLSYIFNYQNSILNYS